MLECVDIGYCCRVKDFVVGCKVKIVCVELVERV